MATTTNPLSANESATASMSVRLRGMPWSKRAAGRFPLAGFAPRPAGWARGGGGRGGRRGEVVRNAKGTHIERGVTRKPRVGIGGRKSGAVDGDWMWRSRLFHYCQRIRNGLGGETERQHYIRRIEAD